VTSAPSKVLEEMVAGQRLLMESHAKFTEALDNISQRVYGLMDGLREPVAQERGKSFEERPAIYVVENATNRDSQGSDALD